MRSASNPADAFPPTSRKSRTPVHCACAKIEVSDNQSEATTKLYNSSKVEVGGNVLTGLNHFAYPMGIILESAPIAIFCLVTGTKGQKWCSGLHGSDLFRPSCRREMGVFYY